MNENQWNIRAEEENGILQEYKQFHCKMNDKSDDPRSRKGRRNIHKVTAGRITMKTKTKIENETEYRIGNTISMSDSRGKCCNEDRINNIS